MRKIVLTFIAVLGLLRPLVAQDVPLPDKISISDKFFSPRGTNPHYEYELKLKGNYYSVEAKTIKENGKDEKESRKYADIDTKLIENILSAIKQDPTSELKASDFQDQFTLDAINSFFKKEADNYWITNEHQKKFIIEELISPDKLKKNLNLYFRNYDHSGYIDGSSTEVKITFHYSDKVLSITSESILMLGLPIEVKGEKNYSPKLASLLGELIPEGKTRRNKQFEGKGLFSAVIQETIGNHRQQIDSLQAKTYQVYIDSLLNIFKVSDAKVTNSTYSANWDGEKRLSCTLNNSSMVSNVSIDYSTTIENEDIKHPVSLIMADYEQLYALVMSSPFFREYLAVNGKRHLSIVYDDNSCFTDKTKDRALMNCKILKTIGSLDHAVFIVLNDEFHNISRWCLLPNGVYFMWWNNGNPPIPTEDKNYLKCE